MKEVDRMGKVAGNMFSAIRFGLDNGYTIQVRIMGDYSGTLYTVADKDSAKVVHAVVIEFDGNRSLIAESEVGDVILSRC
jgi:hypothetical protein